MAVEQQTIPSTHHSWAKIAPKLNEPTSMDETWKSDRGANSGESKKLRPSHERNNSRHQDRSRRNSWFSLIGWSSRRKGRQQIYHTPKKSVVEDRPEEQVNPAQNSQVQSYKYEGPSNFSGWRGIPHSPNRHTQVSILFWQIGKLGGPIVGKSSK